jgi:hypothetical protein
MEDSQGNYSHEEEIIGFHISMGNAKTEYNGRRDRHELVTIRIMQREVHSYRVDNQRIMKAQEEILQILNMLQNRFNKDSGTKEYLEGQGVLVGINIPKGTRLEEHMHIQGYL